jgi:serine/threonine-protein kinase
MGEVYRAHDPRLGRDVAIKVQPEHLTVDPQALARFELEARAVAALSHPNIVAIFDLGNDQGIGYVVTELLEGESLGRRIQRGAIPWREAVDIGIAIGEALSAAHSKGLIHRDLKPDNVFLTTDHQVKLLDFGVVRWKPDAMTSENPPISAQTLAGTLLGTMGYMSPEQLRAETADAPSDIFSFGCVLYEMLTGRRAFRGDSVAETIAAVLKERPAPPGRLEVLIPPDLDRIVASCLEKRPQDRFQSAQALAAALKAVGEAARSTEISRFLPPVPRDAAIDSIAVLPFENASGSPELEYLTDGITESLINSLSQLGSMRVVARSTVFKYKGHEINPETMGRALKVRALLVGRVMQRGELLNVQCELVDVREGSQIWGEQYSHKFRDIFVVQEVIAREIARKLRLKLSREQRKRLTRRYTENSEAYQLYLRGRYYWNKRTPEWMRKGIENFQLAIQTDPGYALAHAGLADCFALLGSYGALSPGDAFQKAKSSALKALEIDTMLAEAHTSLAFTEGFYDWNWQAAQLSFKRAMRLSPSYPTAHHWYSYLLMAHARWDETFATIRRALDLDPLALIINAQLSWALHLSRRYDDAIEQAQKTLEMDPNFGIAQLWLGLSHVQKRDYDKALPTLQSAHQILGAAPIVLGALGQAYALAGLRDVANATIAQLAEQGRERYVTPVAIALIFLGLGELDQAFEWLEKGLEDRSWWLAWLKVDPLFDPGRADPRFQSLTSRVGLT